MRSIWVGIFVTVALFAGLAFSRSQAGHRDGPAHLIKVRTERVANPEEDIVKGYGIDAAKARERALEQAQQRVRDQLAEKLGTSWRPSEEVLDVKYLTHFEVVRSLGDPVLEPTLKDGTLVASYQVSLNRDYLREVSRVARHEQMSDRHLIAARVLIGLVALLLVVTGYLRLEELTRGYATTTLRAAAVGLLLVVVMGLLMTA